MYPRRSSVSTSPPRCQGQRSQAATAFDPERWTTISLLPRRGAGEQPTETQCHVLVSLRLENAQLRVEKEILQLGGRSS